MVRTDFSLKCQNVVESKYVMFAECMFRAKKLREGLRGVAAQAYTRVEDKFWLQDS